MRNLKLHEVNQLIEKYGENTTLKSLVTSYCLPYLCPQCKGTGSYLKKVVTPYPSGFPDSGWVPDTVEYKSSPCILCDSEGYTDREYQAKMVQSGWDEVAE